MKLRIRIQKILLLNLMEIKKNYVNLRIFWKKRIFFHLIKMKGLQLFLNIQN